MPTYFFYSGKQREQCQRDGRKPIYCKLNNGDIREFTEQCDVENGAYGKNPIPFTKRFSDGTELGEGIYLGSLTELSLSDASLLEQQRRERLTKIKKEMYG